jgi:hypothetical protein
MIEDIKIDIYSSNSQYITKNSKKVKSLNILKNNVIENNHSMIL